MLTSHNGYRKGKPMEDQNKDLRTDSVPAEPAQAAPAEPAPAEPAAPTEAAEPAEAAQAPAADPAPVDVPDAASASSPVRDDKLTNNVTGTKGTPAPLPQQPGAAPDTAPYVAGAAVQQPTAGAPQQPVSPYATPQQPFGGPAAPATPYGSQPGAPVPPYGVVPSMQAAPAGSGKATGALVCGILAIVLCAAPIVGIVLGIVAIVMAGSYLKGFGPDGRAKAGRICGIIGIVLSILLYVFAIGTMLWAFNQVSSASTVEMTPSSAQSPGSSSASGGSSSSSSPIYDEDEQTVLDLVSAQFDALEAGDEEMMQSVASIAAAGFEEATGITMEQCGIDPVSYARLMTDGLTYEIDLVVVNDKQGTGWVSADVTCRDIFSVLELFNEKVDAFDRSGEANSMTEEQVHQKLGELLMAAVSETTETADDYATINCTLEDGTWVMSEEDWTTELDYLFGLV